LNIIERENCELAVEGVGVACQILGDKIDTGFVLSKLFTNVRSDHLRAINILYHALRDIANGLDASIQDVIKENVDHLSKDLNLNLRKVNSLSNPGVQMLVKIVMRVSAQDQRMTDLQDTMDTLLRHLAVADEETTNKILQIVHVFVEAMKERMENNKDVCVSSSKKVEDNKGLITNMILKLEEERLNDEKIAEEALKCPEDGFHDKTEEPNDNNEDPVEENNNEVNSKLTEEQKWLESVVKNVRHFISMQGQPTWQITCIRIVSTCLELLSGTEDQQQGGKQTCLLPLVHLTWQPLKLCFKSSNLLLVDSSFQCVMVIAQVARDFVHNRTVNDVFPALMQFLTNLQVMVSDRDKQQTLVAIQSRRILARLCKGIWSLIELLDLHPLETDPIIQLVLDHLGEDLRVKGEDTGDMEVSTLGSRLKVQDTDPGHLLLPQRNVDKNILWLKMKCIQENIK